MLSEALTYPVRGEGREETLLVGAILAVAVGLLARLGVLAFLALVPAVMLAGYAQSVLRATVESPGGTAAAEDAPPAFRTVRALAADGLRALAVAGGYLVVPAAALLLTVGGASAGGRPDSLGITVFVFGAGTVVLFVSLGFAYLLPAALAGVARTGDLGAALDRGRLLGSARSGGYFLGWVAAVVTGAIFVVTLGSLAALGRPGEVAALAGGFYALVVVARLFGRGISG
ncbi:DUF4013 domain-containing protein [Halorussus limi]|uniref:DUF4013 domain-containing protein n=1 Tax=Halorussus limi TaxID=2938695 RepID=A0A8U0HV80_9EURY|nr:DUF4013 domain-containing protein [Halorussus limi]UPV74631.1 DUF4013 domain-containing protein [Halorussus limi]